MAYIYKITNLINNKIYIGKTILAIEERWQQHQKKAQHFPNRYLYDAMNHYGYKNFKIEAIEECAEEKLNEREIYWIAYYDSTNHDIGYNLTIGGDGGNTTQYIQDKVGYGDKLRQGHLKENYTEITKESLQQDINDLLTVEEMVKKYHSTPGTINKRCKLYFGDTLGNLRNVPNSGQFIKKEINEEKLLNILYDFKLELEDIAKELRVDVKTLRNYCKEQYGFTAEELRKQYGINYLQSLPKQNKKLDPNDKEQVELLNKLFYYNLSEEKISAYFNITKKTLYNKIKIIYNLTSIREVKKYVKQQ